MGAPIPSVIHVSRGGAKAVVHACYVSGTMTLCGQIRDMDVLKVTGRSISCRMCRMLEARIAWMVSPSLKGQASLRDGVTAYEKELT